MVIAEKAKIKTRETIGTDISIDRNSIKPLKLINKITRAAANSRCHKTLTFAPYTAVINYDITQGVTYVLLHQRMAQQNGNPDDSRRRGAVHIQQHRRSTNRMECLALSTKKSGAIRLSHRHSAENENTRHRIGNHSLHNNIFRLAK